VGVIIFQKSFLLSRALMSNAHIFDNQAAITQRIKHNNCNQIISSLGRFCITGDFVLRRMFVDSGHISNKIMGNNHMIAVIALETQSDSRSNKTLTAIKKRSVFSVVDILNTCP